jgi:F-type H+-transporting ATPase subunit a
MHISLTADTIFKPFGLPITNSILMTWLVILIFLISTAVLRVKKLKSIPRGIQNFFEWIIESLLKLINQVTHDPIKSQRFLPLVGTIFLFILISNWLGQLPGVGTIGLKHGAGLIPILRPGTSDLNTTLGLAVLTVVSTHIFGIITLGFFTHLNKYINFKEIFKALKAFNPLKIFTAIVNLFIGIIELFSEVAKMISLSLRLFGNIFAGEVLLTVMSSLIAYLVPLPFMFLELIVGAVQALIFSMLAIVFLEMATRHGH